MFLETLKISIEVFFAPQTVSNFLYDILCNLIATFIKFKDGTSVNGGLYYALHQVTGSEGLKIDKGKT